MDIAPCYTEGLFDIRHLIINSVIYFAGRDVAEKLDYTNPNQAVKDHVKPKYKKYLHELIDTSRLSRNEGNMIYISEYGLYFWLGTSKSEKAVPFQDFLFERVVPQLRQQMFQDQDSMTKEIQLHHKVVSFIRKYHPTALLVAGLGELQSTESLRLFSWRSGYRAGQPDLIICNHHKHHSSFALEMKNPNGQGKLSDKQVTTLEAYRQANYKVMVSNCYEDIIISIIDYMMNTRVCCDFCKKKFKTASSLKAHEVNFHKINNP